MEVALHRSVEDILHGYEGLISADAAEKQRTEGELFSGSEKLLRHYEEILGMRTPYIYEIAPKIKPEVVLSPEQINLFLQQTIPYENDIYYPTTTGLFLTKLMQDSYDAGNNRFCLNTGAIDTKIGWLGYKLTGRKKEPIEMRIEGDTDWCLCSTAEYVNVNVSGEVGSECANSARHVSVSAQKIGYKCGRKAKHCNFKAADRESIELMKQSVCWGNRIYFIKPNGSERRTRRLLLYLKDKIEDLKRTARRQIW